MISPAGIKTLQPGRVLRDDVVTGLEVRSFANGRQVYYLWFRTKLGKARHPKIGDCAVMSLADARRIAKEMLTEVAAGRDPIADRGNAKREPTMADLWDKFWSLHARHLKSGEDYRRMWEKIIRPKHAETRVRGFTYEAAVGLHRGFEATPYQANRILQFLSVMFNFAERPLKWRDLHSNPCAGIKHYQEIKRRRYATPDELTAINKDLAAWEAERPQEVAFIYLLLYSGARPGEIETAQRAWLDTLPEGGGVLRLPDSKTGQRDVYLPPQAMAVIGKLPEYRDGTICGRDQPRKFWANVRRRAGCPDLRMYPDLRRSFATTAFSAGLSIDAVGGMLGHKTRQTTLVYAHLREDAAAQASTAAGNAMAMLLQGKGKADVGASVEQPGGADQQAAVEVEPRSDQPV
jgi:integrase